MLVPIYFLVPQGHVEDDEDFDEYDDIADILNEYDEEEDIIGEANDSEKENVVSDLVETIFCDGERILGEVDEEVGDEDWAVSQRSGSPQVEGVKIQCLSTNNSPCYQRSPTNWQASKLKTPSLKDFTTLKACSTSVC